jgi:hypothetical protein
MITICKGEHTLEVTNGAFRNFYQRLGYKPVRGSRSVENPGEVNTHPDEEKHLSGELEAPSEDGEPTGEEYPDEDEVPLAEIPLSEMTHSQLLEYAEQLGLEFAANISRKDLRKLIRQHTA